MVGCSSSADDPDALVVGGDAAAADATTDAALPVDASPDTEIPDAGPDAEPPDAAGPDAAWTCTSCHGEGDNPAPPADTHGASSTSERGVGAHRTHLRSSRLFRTGECSDCHVVPATIEEAGHRGDTPAELVWGSVPSAGGTPTWDGETCSLYCHGQTLPGGTNRTPEWTRVDEGEAACGSCHSVPPPAPHPPITNWSCAGCHPFAGLLPVDPERHVDGTLDLAVGCTTCHGSDATGPAPPLGTHGESQTSTRAVGAHQSHVATSTWHAAVACEECHVVPEVDGEPAHIDGDDDAEVVFGALATAEGATPTWGGTTCSGAYCHGVTLSGGTITAPAWTTVDGSQAACGTCHGLPPTTDHPPQTDCSLCHGDVVDASRNIIAPDLHVNGTVNVSATACGSCHAVPPETGTHLVHAGLAAPVYGDLGTTTTGDGYALGCGNCHPTSESRHMNGGRAEVELYDPTAPSGTLKALHPSTAAYAPGGAIFVDPDGLSYTLGTCSDAYCHSGMQTTSSDVAEPGVDFPFTDYPIVYDPPYTVTRTRSYRTATWGSPLGCGGCHGYPPRASFPTDTAGAGESHSYIGPQGWEDFHTWNHGFDPLPCRTCHSQTVTQIASFARDGSGVVTFDDIDIGGFDRHVNGARDVVFDPSPYVYSTTMRGPVPMDLSTASWNAGARTCTAVACHFSQTSVTFGSPYRSTNGPECNSCHRY